MGANEMDKKKFSKVGIGLAQGFGPHFGTVVLLNGDNDPSQFSNSARIRFNTKRILTRFPSSTWKTSAWY